MYSVRHQQVTADEARIYCAAMRWMEIRKQYAELYAEFKKNGGNQQDVAERGGLSDQSAISKLVNNENLGPAVETFVRAVEGLGITVSSFFRRIEALQNSAVDEHNAPLVRTSVKEGLPSDSPIPPPTTDADRALYFKLGRLLMAAAGTGAATGERDIAKNKRAARAPAKRGGKR